MTSPELWDRGLNLLAPDETSEAEIEGLRQWMTGEIGYAHPGLEFWLENRPDDLKRFRLHVYMSETNICSILATLHFYAIVGFSAGAEYITQSARHVYGVTKAQILETLAVAFIHAGPRGMQAVADGAANLIRELDDPAEPPVFPDGWAPDPDAFRSGIDFARPELTTRDKKRLDDWYERTCGEVPLYVRFLARENPNLLKAYRNRFEHAIRDALPKQMMPYLLLHWNTVRGWREGIREAALLGRGFGMSRSDVTHAIGRASAIDGGVASTTIAASALEDILADWA